MAVSVSKNYWIYQISIGESEMFDLEDFVRNGRSEYVAGLLIGKLKSNGKFVVSKNDNEELTK